MKTYEQRFSDVSARIYKRVRAKKIATGSCVALVVVALALILFVPYNTNPPSVSRYADSQYYDLIQKINEATYQPPRYVNNFDAIVSTVKKFGMAGSAMDNAAPESGTGTYVEVTDNQVAGVIESDIIKRSSEYIYYLRNGVLSVYTIAGNASELYSEYTVFNEYKSEDEYFYFEDTQMYLTVDCTTVTVVADGFDSEIGSCTMLISLDVTDPMQITEKGKLYITGGYLSSRMVDEKLLLMSKFRISGNCDFSDESTFLPQVGTPENMRSVAAEDILSPEELSNTYYTVVCAVDAKSLELMDTAAFLSYSDDVYVSNDRLYATRGYSVSNEVYSNRSMTEISCLDYSGETMEYMGSVTVAGSVKNQYSMDEYNGIFRVVTSIRETIQQVDGETASAKLIRSASLYCFDLEDFSLVASVEQFAPVGEQAESVRFDQDVCYVCTAEIVEVTDPVFFFDLSDINNITWTDTGTIEGYSTSLVNLGEGILLGIGYGDSLNLKLEIYEEAVDRVISICTYERDASFSEDYKAYLIDRENDLIGLGLSDWNGGTRYVLFHFDGYEINKLCFVDTSGDLSKMRGVLIDGWLYVFSDEFHVVKAW